jgi:hypothetical protein
MTAILQKRETWRKAFEWNCRLAIMGNAGGYAFPRFSNPIYLGGVLVGHVIGRRQAPSLSEPLGSDFNSTPPSSLETRRPDTVVLD